MLLPWAQIIMQVFLPPEAPAPPMALSTGAIQCSSCPSASSSSRPLLYPFLPNNALQRHTTTYNFLDHFQLVQIREQREFCIVATRNSRACLDFVHNHALRKVCFMFDVTTLFGYYFRAVLGVIECSLKKKLSQIRDQWVRQTRLGHVQLNNPSDPALPLLLGDVEGRLTRGMHFGHFSNKEDGTPPLPHLPSNDLLLVILLWNQVKMHLIANFH